MHVLVWYENDYDINAFMVLSYSQDENKLYEIKKLFDGVDQKIYKRSPEQLVVIK